MFFKALDIYHYTYFQKAVIKLHLGQGGGRSIGTIGSVRKYLRTILLKKYNNAFYFEYVEENVYYYIAIIICSMS